MKFKLVESVNDQNHLEFFKILESLGFIKTSQGYKLKNSEHWIIVNYADGQGAVRVTADYDDEIFQDNQLNKALGYIKDTMKSFNFDISDKIASNNSTDVRNSSQNVSESTLNNFIQLCLNLGKQLFFKDSNNQIKRVNPKKYSDIKVDQLADIYIGRTGKEGTDLLSVLDNLKNKNLIEELEMKFKLVEAIESKICCICKKPFDGYGNNAEPVCSGSCCDECNMKEVIPARLKMLKKPSKKNESYEPGAYGDRIFDLLDKMSGDDILRCLKQWDYLEVLNISLDDISMYEVYDKITDFLESDSGAGLYNALDKYCHWNNICESINDLKKSKIHESLSEREITNILSDARDNSDDSEPFEYWIGFSAAAYSVKESDLFLLLADHIDETDKEYQDMLRGYKDNNGSIGIVNESLTDFKNRLCEILTNSGFELSKYFASKTINSDQTLVFHPSINLKAYKLYVKDAAGEKIDEVEVRGYNLNTLASILNIYENNFIKYGSFEPNMNESLNEATRKANIYQKVDRLAEIFEKKGFLVATDYDLKSEMFYKLDRYGEESPLYYSIIVIGVTEEDLDIEALELADSYPAIYVYEKADKDKNNLPDTIYQVVNKSSDAYNVTDEKEAISYVLKWLNLENDTLTEDLEDYKITYYLSTATAERRPETIEDVENDWKEEVFAADSDYDALLYALELIDSSYDDTDFSTAEEIVKYFEEKDLGDGSAFVVKLEGPNGVIYDMGQTKDDFVGQIKDNDEMLAYYRGVLGIDESLEESLRNPKPSMFKRLCKSSDKALCQKACDIMYDWYSNEDVFDDFDTISDFIDFVSADIYDMIDAATDEEKNTVLAALNPSKDSDKYIKFIEENFDTLLANLEALDINDLIKNNSLEEIAEKLALMYHKSMNRSATEPYEESKFKIAFKKYLSNRSINESLNEAIDPSKALEVKKNSDADVIFYGWQYKNEEPVEIDPEELTYEEYQNRKNRIVSDYNKLYADKPQANRYAKEHDFIFYALHNRKNEELNEDIDSDLLQKYKFEDKIENYIEQYIDYEARAKYVDFTDNVLTWISQEEMTYEYTKDIVKYFNKFLLKTGGYEGKVIKVKTDVRNTGSSFETQFKVSKSLKFIEETDPIKSYFIKNQNKLDKSCYKSFMETVDKNIVPEADEIESLLDAIIDCHKYKWGNGLPMTGDQLSEHIYYLANEYRDELDYYLGAYGEGLFTKYFSNQFIEDEEDWNDGEEPDDDTDFDIDESAEYNFMEALYKGSDFDDHDDEDEIDYFYHDASEEELRKMGAFDNLNDEEDDPLENDLISNNYNDEI